jgi:O-antigen ligase
MIQSPATKISTGMLPLYEKINWLHVLVLEIAAVLFFLPAGRFHFSLFGLSISTGYDAYKLFPVIFITWYGWRIYNAHKPWPRSPMLFPLCCFFLLTLFVSIFSLDTYESITESLEILCYIAFLFILLDIPWDQRYLTWVGAVFVIGHIYLGALALHQFFSAEQWGDIRANGNFDHPNELGGYTLLGITILLCLFLWSRKKTVRTVLLSVVVLTVITAITTLSRGTYVTLLAWSLVLFWQGTGSIRKWVAIGTGLALVLILVWNPSILSRMNTVFDHPLISDNPPPRTHIWSYLMDSEIPDLAFFGFGLHRIATDRMENNIPSAQHPYTIDSAHAPHNQYLAMLVSSGVLGLFMLFWLGWLALCRAKTLEPNLAAVLIAGLASFIVNCTFEAPILATNIPLALTVILAILSWHGQQQQVDKKQL